MDGCGRKFHASKTEGDRGRGRKQNEGALLPLTKQTGRERESGSPFLIVRGKRVQITGGARVYQKDVTGPADDAYKPTIHVFDVIAVVKSANITVRSTVIAPLAAFSCLHVSIAAVNVP